MKTIITFLVYLSLGLYQHSESLLQL